MRTFAVILSILLLFDGTAAMGQTTQATQPAQPPAWFTQAAEQLRKPPVRDWTTTATAKIAAENVHHVRDKDIPLLATQAVEGPARNLAIAMLVQAAPKHPAALDALRLLVAGERPNSAIYALAHAPPDLARPVLELVMKDGKASWTGVDRASELLGIVGNEQSVDLLDARAERLRNMGPDFRIRMIEPIYMLRAILAEPADQREALRDCELRFWRARTERPGMHVEYDDYPIVTRLAYQRGDRWPAKFLLGKLPANPKRYRQREDALLDSAVLAMLLLGRQREASAVPRLNELLATLPTPAAESLASIGTPEAIRALVIADPGEDQKIARLAVLQYGDGKTLDALLAVASDPTLPAKPHVLAVELYDALRAKLPKTQQR